MFPGPVLPDPMTLIFCGADLAEQKGWSVLLCSISPPFSITPAVALFSLITLLADDSSGKEEDQA